MKIGLPGMGGGPGAAKKGPPAVPAPIEESNNLGGT